MLTTKRHRTAVICENQGKLLTCLFRDPKTKKEFYVVPGGKIETHESAKECAEREVKEETGYHVQVGDRPEQTTHYVFDWGGVEYVCFTAWFIGSLKKPFQEPKPVKDADFNLSVMWLPYDHISKEFSYHDHIKEMVFKLMNKTMNSQS